MVLFMGEYYITSSYEEEEDVITDFYNSDACHTLIIIDEYNRIERYKEMRGDMNIAVTWLTEQSAPEEGRKVIFINEKLDKLVQEYMLQHGGTLGFFRG